MVSVGRWPEPRPPLFLQPAGAPGEAALIRGPLGPGLPDERAWLLHADAPTAADHGGAFELRLTAARTSLGCNRCLALTLHTSNKAGAAIGRFRWTAPLTDRDALRALGALDRQPWWRVLVCAPNGALHAVELANTLRVATLVRGVFAVQP